MKFHIVKLLYTCVVKYDSFALLYGFYFQKRTYRKWHNFKHKQLQNYLNDQLELVVECTIKSFKCYQILPILSDTIVSGTIPTVILAFSNVPFELAIKIDGASRRKFFRFGRFGRLCI